MYSEEILEKVVVHHDGSMEVISVTNVLKDGVIIAQNQNSSMINLDDSLDGKSKKVCDIAAVVRKDKGK